MHLRELIFHPQQAGPPVPGPGDSPGLTILQLMTILEEARHSIIIIEHGPLLYKDAVEMIDLASKA
jgi:hypothetical protein